MSTAHKKQVSPGPVLPCASARPCPALLWLPAAGSDLGDQHLLRGSRAGDLETVLFPAPGWCPQVQGHEASPWLSWSHKLALFSVFVKNLWFYFLYSYEEKNYVFFTVYVADTVYFEQFCFFPLKNHFLGEAGKTRCPSWPVPSPKCAAALHHSLPHTHAS